jgi:O-antigen ligase
VSPGLRLGSLLSVALGGAILVDFTGGSLRFPYVFLSLLLVLPPAIVHGRALLGDARDRTFLLTVCLVAAWVVVAQHASIAFEVSIGATLAVLVACGVAIVVRALHRAGQGVVLLWLLAGATAAWALWAGLRTHFAGVDPYLFRDRNVLADGVFVAALVALAELLRAGGSRSAERYIWFGAAVLLLAGVTALTLLGARVGWLMLLVAAVILVAVEARGHAARRLLWLWPAAVLVALVVDPALQVFAAPQPATGGGSGDSVDSSLFIRTTLLASALELLPERPLFGSGLLTFFLQFEPRQDPAFVHGGAMVHNDYLQIALTLGWPAGLAAVVLVGRVLRDWGRAIGARRAEDPARGARERVFLLAVLGVLGHALLNFPLHDAALLCLLAALLALGLGADEQETAVGQPPGRLPTLVVALTLMVCLAQTVQAGLVAVEAVVLRSQSPAPGVAPPRLSVGTVASVASRLRGLPYGNPAFQEGRILADLWEASGRSDETLVVAALAAFSDARQRSPHVTEYAIQYARLLRETGRPLAERRTVLETQLARRPKDARLWLALAVHTLQAGRVDDAVAVARQRWLPWCAHGLARVQETRDLVALALEGEGEMAPLQACLRRTEARGIPRTTLAELRVRFPARGPRAVDAPDQS